MFTTCDLYQEKQMPEPHTAV